MADSGAIKGAPPNGLSMADILAMAKPVASHIKNGDLVIRETQFLDVSGSKLPGGGSISGAGRHGWRVDVFLPDGTLQATGTVFSDKNGTMPFRTQAERVAAVLGSAGRPAVNPAGSTATTLCGRLATGLGKVANAAAGVAGKLSVATTFTSALVASDDKIVKEEFEKAKNDPGYFATLLATNPMMAYSVLKEARKQKVTLGPKPMA